MSDFLAAAIGGVALALDLVLPLAGNCDAAPPA
jgi:hypothetical protein